MKKFMFFAVVALTFGLAACQTNESKVSKVDSTVQEENCVTDSVADSTQDSVAENQVPPVDQPTENDQTVK